MDSAFDRYVRAAEDAIQAFHNMPHDPRYARSGADYYNAMRMNNLAQAVTQLTHALAQLVKSRGGG